MREVFQVTEEMNQELDQESVVVLVDEEGIEHEFLLVDMIEVDGNQYAVLSPVDGEEESDEAIILKIAVDENGEEMLYDIEDDEEWEKVVDLWNDSFED